MLNSKIASYFGSLSFFPSSRNGVIFALVANGSKVVVNIIEDLLSFTHKHTITHELAIVGAITHTRYVCVAYSANTALYLKHISHQTQSTKSININRVVCANVNFCRNKF